MKKAIRSGKTATSTEWLKRWKKLPEEEPASSFCNNKASKTRIPIMANEPAIELVVIVNTVAVVTVEIMLLPTFFPGLPRVDREPEIHNLPL